MWLCAHTYAILLVTHDGDGVFVYALSSADGFFFLYCLSVCANLSMCFAAH